MPHAFELKNVGFRYTKSPVLEDISCEITGGEFVALVGPNGSGKSTLCKIMAGLLTGYRGSVRFDGKDLDDLTREDIARRIAFVPQETHMVFPFTVAEVVLMGRLLQ